MNQDKAIWFIIVIALFIFRWTKRNANKSAKDKMTITLITCTNVIDVIAGIAVILFLLEHSS